MHALSIHLERLRMKARHPQPKRMQSLLRFCFLGLSRKPSQVELDFAEYQVWHPACYLIADVWLCMLFE